MDDFKKLFGKQVKYYRSLSNYTQESLSEKMGLSVTTISNIETGYNFPSYPVLKALVETLNIHPAQLFLFNLEDNDILKNTKDKIFIDSLCACIKNLSDEQKDAILNIAKLMGKNNKAQ